MRVCYKCGAIDSAYWKHVRWSYYIDSCSFENFEIMYPKMATQLFKASLCEDEHYVYRMTKKKHPPLWVERKAKVDFTIGWSDCCEKFPHTKANHKKRMIGGVKTPRDFAKDWSKLHPNQRKLLEEKQP